MCETFYPYSSTAVQYCRLLYRNIADFWRLLSTAYCILTLILTSTSGRVRYAIFTPGVQFLTSVDQFGGEKTRNKAPIAAFATRPQPALPGKEDASQVQPT